MTSDTVLKDALASLVAYGFMIVKNVSVINYSFYFLFAIAFVLQIPPSIEFSQKAIERISHIQKTLYGEITILTAKGDREDSAYSNVALKAHHDCTYLKNSPGYVSIILKFSSSSLKSKKSFKIRNFSIDQT